MTRIAVVCEYSMNTTGLVDLPEGKTWEDVESWHVKWDIFHFKLKEDDAWLEFRMDSAGGVENVDWKRPAHIEVVPVDEDGDIGWDQVLAEAS